MRVRWGHSVRGAELHIEVGQGLLLLSQFRARELKCCHDLRRVLNAVKTLSLGIRYVICRLPSSCVSPDAFLNRRISEANYSSLLFPALPRPWMSVPPKRNLGIGDMHKGLSHFTDSIYIYVTIYIYILCILPKLKSSGPCSHEGPVCPPPLPAPSSPPAPPCNFLVALRVVSND